MATRLGICRKVVYYTPKQKKKDEELVAQIQEDVVAMAKMIEPEKWMDILTRIDVVDTLRPSWLPDRDSNPNIQIQILKSYH